MNHEERQIWEDSCHFWDAIKEQLPHELDGTFFRVAVFPIGQYGILESNDGLVVKGKPRFTDKLNKIPWASSVEEWREQFVHMIGKCCVIGTDALPERRVAVVVYPYLSWSEGQRIAAKMGHFPAWLRTRVECLPLEVLVMHENMPAIPSPTAVRVNQHDMTPTFQTQTVGQHKWGWATVQYGDAIFRVFGLHDTGSPKFLLTNHDDLHRTRDAMGMTESNSSTHPTEGTAWRVSNPGGEKVMVYASEDQPNAAAHNVNIFGKAYCEGAYKVCTPDGRVMLDFSRNGSNAQKFLQQQTGGGGWVRLVAGVAVLFGGAAAGIAISRRRRV